MAITEFKTFGAGPGDDSTSQATYALATWRIQGWTSGILPHQQINKVLRQTSAVAAALTQTVADLTLQDVFDNNNLIALTNQIKLAFSAYLPYNSLINYPVGSIGYAIQNSLGGGSMSGPAIIAAINGLITNTELGATLLGRINLIDAPTTGLVTKVADLTTAYGSTTAAATSAATAAQAVIDATAARNAAAVSAGAALTSETNAFSSRTAASTSAGAASTSATAAAGSQTSAAGSATAASTSATTASNAATTASNAATAAAGSSTSAATSATNAGTFATAADASRTAAQTEAGNAAISSSNAASSASSASGSASTATTQANLAVTSQFNAAASATAAGNSASTATTQVTLANVQASIATTKAIEAATSADDASGSAVAAANSASSALTSSNTAGSSASAANSSSVSAAASASAASAALGQTARSNIASRILASTGGPFLSPSDISWGLSGWGYSMVGNGAQQLASINLAPLVPGAVYSVSFKAKLLVGSTTVTLGFDFFPDTLPDAQRSVGSSEATEFTWEGVSSASGDWVTASLRFFASVAIGTTLEITDIKVEQNSVVTPFVINPRDVLYHAQAAAASSSSATASATAAGTSATASQNARVAAESAAAGASSSQTAAAGSATSAAGSVSSATTQAITAATAAGNAGTFATAANTSAANASVSASNALASENSAASWYNSTVSATGSLTAQVALKANTSALATTDGRVAVTEANLTLKTVATRSDGKLVIGGIGVASTASGVVGQSEILLQADKLAFVPTSDPNAGLVRPFVVGLVNGVTTLIVDAAVIGDATVSRLKIAPGSLVQNLYTSPTTSSNSGSSSVSGVLPISTVLTFSGEGFPLQILGGGNFVLNTSAPIAFAEIFFNVIIDGFLNPDGGCSLSGEQLGRQFGSGSRISRHFNLAFLQSGLSAGSHTLQVQVDAAFYNSAGSPVTANWDMFSAFRIWTQENKI